MDGSLHFDSVYYRFGHGIVCSDLRRGVVFGHRNHQLDVPVDGKGAIISVLLVIFALPAMFMLFDKIICKTTLGMAKISTTKIREVSINE